MNCYCTITKTIVVTQPTSLTVTSTLTPATCGNANGSGTVTVAGGSPGYTYNWSNGGLTNVLSAASAGNYTVTIQDLNGCVLTNTVAITNIPGPTAITVQPVKVVVPVIAVGPGIFVIVTVFVKIQPFKS